MAQSSDGLQIPPMEQTVIARFHRALTRAPVAMSVVVVAVAMFVACGFAGVGRGGAPLHGDLRFPVAAGQAWLAGANPYVLAELDRAVSPALGLRFTELGYGFAYPPQISAFCMLLAALGWKSASALMTLLNSASAAVIAWCCYKMASAQRTTRQKGTDLGLAAAAVALTFGNPFAQHVAFMGQTSLTVAALLCGGFYLVSAGRSSWLAAVLFACATIKPQIAVLPLAWLLIERRFLLCVYTAVIALVLCMPAFVLQGPADTIRTWLASVSMYEQGDVQRAGFQHVFSLQSLFVSAGLRVPSLWPLAVAGVGAVYYFRTRINALERLGALVAVSFLGLYAHDYDLVACTPLLVAAWDRTAYRHRLELAMLITTAILFFPQRFVRNVPVPVLYHWRELVMLAMLTALALIVRASTQASAGTVNQGTRTLLQRD